MVLKESEFIPLVVSGNIFGCHAEEGGATGFWWTELRDAIKNPTVHRTDPTRKNCLAPNVNSDEAEKPRYGKLL